MAGTLHTDAYKSVMRAFVTARLDVGMLQAELGRRIGRDQSFVSNIERGQRRLDVLEAFVIAKALGLDPGEFFARLVKSVPSTTAL